MESTNWLILGRGYSLFGMALFKSVKSIQTRHVSLGLATTTGLDKQSGKSIGLIIQAASNYCTSFLITSCLALAKLASSENLNSFLMGLPTYVL